MNQDNTKLPEKFLLDKKLIDISFLTKDVLVNPDATEEPDEEWTIDSLYDDLIAYLKKSKPASCIVLS
jgi:hypothetical protein